MTRPRPQFEPEPRVWSEHQVACRFGRGDSWLRDNRPNLEAAGFPQADDLLGGTDGDAVNHWLDMRSGMTDASKTDDDELSRRLEAFRDGKLQGAVSD